MRSLSICLTLALLVALCAAACAGSASPNADATSRSCTAPYPSGTPDAESVFCSDPALLDSARTVHIVDGDTLDVLVGGTKERVRLFGVDTPERGDRCYSEATARLRALADKDVLLRGDARNRDRNGRLLRYVFTPTGVSVDAILVDEGLAVAWTRDGIARDALVALEQRARQQHAGCLWK